MGKYCTTCKNTLQSNEAFCTHCGTPSQFSRSEIIHQQTDRGKMKTLIWCSVLVLVFLALIVGLFFGVFAFWTNQVGKAQPRASHLPPTHKVEIDINSPMFSQGYMHSPHTDGYEGFELGEAKSTIEKEYGRAEGTKTIDGNKVELYGNMGVSYNSENQVNHVFVVPGEMTKDDFTNFHSTPDEISNGVWYYDADEANGFSIKVYTSKNNIEAIENVEQK
ncbi:hypothetical protein ACY2DA_00630 [Staphylococcus simulans]